MSDLGDLIRSMKGPTITVSDFPRRLPSSPKRKRSLKVNAMLCELIEMSNKVMHPLEVATGAHEEPTSMSTISVIKNLENGKRYEVIVRELR